MEVKCKVTAKRLNRRSVIPRLLSDKQGINGTVMLGFEFLGTLVEPADAATGKWVRDQDGNFYWGGGLQITPLPVAAPATAIAPDIKTKIMRVVNMFETGTPDGNYGMLVTYKDYTNPLTKALSIQITYGRSQTTEFGHLKALIQDYVNKGGVQAEVFRAYLDRLGQQPSLAGDARFKQALKEAGKDPIMKTCQDQLFETKYYAPALSWFQKNGFHLPLSLLVIYDSRIHSGGILPFLRNRIQSPAPSAGGDEHTWVEQYVAVRHHWLSLHSNPLLRKTVYRTACFSEQIRNDNWDLLKPIQANGKLIS